ncbi:MAG: mercury methylation corrinoid protein HgcA [Anaerolineaceae bacterium]|nr:mercury methylation corrinoid protein HgcA [Anaerolineaceae bacterium]
MQILSNPPIRATTSQLAWPEHFDHIRARLGINRMGHHIEPGLYTIGAPTADSPIFVSANYTLSFDALRSALSGLDGYILVLDTDGVNVWCAAGKGTFGTDELVNRIEQTGLGSITHQRTLILPQLGAPGVAAQDVKKRSGFKVEYGPVRAADLAEYLKTRQATSEMRRVQFTLTDRLKVSLVDLIVAIWPMLVAALLLYLLGGWRPALAVITVTLAGEILFPMLLPWLPTRDFSSKGLILGGLAALPFAVLAFLGHPQMVWWLRLAAGLDYLFALAPVTGLLALLFTGSTTFTSRTGVKREIATYVPILAWIFGAGALLTIGLFAARLLGVQS